MFAYSTKNFDTYVGWFRNSEGDLQQGAATGSNGGNVVGGGVGQQNASADSDLFIFYNQIKMVPGFLIEPYYFLYLNNLPTNCPPGAAGNDANSTCGISAGNGGNAIGGLGAPKHAEQTRHMVGNRIEMRKGNWDAINEIAWQFGRMSETTTGAQAASGLAP